MDEIAQKALKRALLIPLGRDAAIPQKTIEFTQHCASFTFSFGFEAGGAEQLHGVFDHHCSFPDKVSLSQ